MKLRALLLLLFPVYLFAQENGTDIFSADSLDNTKPAYEEDNMGRQLSISVGTTIPLGKFASTDYANDRNAGSAKPGLDFTLNYKKGFNQFVGFTTTVGVFTSPIDEAAYEKRTEEVLQTEATNFSYGGYKVGYIGLGLYTRLPVDRFSFDLKVEGNMAFGSDDEVSFNITDSSNTVYLFSIDKQNKTSYLFTAGFTARYKVSDHLSVLLNAEYRSVFFRFKDVPARVNGEQVGFVEYDREMKIVAISLGVGWHF